MWIFKQCLSSRNHFQNYQCVPLNNLWTCRLQSDPAAYSTALKEDEKTEKKDNDTKLGIVLEQGCQVSDKKFPKDPPWVSKHILSQQNCIFGYTVTLVGNQSWTRGSLSNVGLWLMTYELVIFTTMSLI